MFILRPIQSIFRICGQSIRFNSTIGINSSRLYCFKLIRHRDRVSYNQHGLIPKFARDAHLVISALNIEMALIPETVSNQRAREMRMQFWKDVVEDCFRGEPKAEQPISILLAHVLSNGRTKLTKSFFQTMISERV